MYLWIDDERKPPTDKNIHWIWAKTVDEAKVAITFYKRQYWSNFIYIDLDHDAGDCRKHGGDYIYDQCIDEINKYIQEDYYGE